MLSQKSVFGTKNKKYFSMFCFRIVYIIEQKGKRGIKIISVQIRRVSSCFWLKSSAWDTLLFVKKTKMTLVYFLLRLYNIKDKEKSGTKN